MARSRTRSSGPRQPSAHDVLRRAVGTVLEPATGEDHSLGEPDQSQTGRRWYRRPQRRRQVDHDADGGGSHPTIRRARPGPRRAVRRDPQPRSPRRCPARRVRPARRPYGSRGAGAGRPADGASRDPRRRDAGPGRPEPDRVPPPGGDYSLGMRQRLGIAHALLGDPQVLILDEPANGLDPAGIRWMRGLLRGFADRGGTVLLSSHLLHEIEVIADEIVMIGRGRIVAQGTKQSLLSPSGTYVRGLDNAALSAALKRAGVESSTDGRGGFVTDATAERLARAAAEAGTVLLELRPADGAGLEDMFLSLTADDAR
ncbi:MAG: ATP-binding cassette domain-containing protein, partial [Actinomycetota bacterium]|nr:ATP-binding cassette domain-containing protein [Actinomycetota bacterium]